MAYQQPEHDYFPEDDTGFMAGAGAGVQQVNHMLRATLDGAPEMIAIEDVNSRYLAFNKAYHDEFQRVFSIDLKIGDSMMQAIAHLPEEQRAASVIFERTIGGEEFTITHAFGDERLARRYYELHCFPIRDSAGRVIGGSHIARDVTGLRQAEEALRASRANYQRIIETSKDCIKMVDLEGRVLSINPGGQRLMELEDLNGYLGHSWVEGWPGEEERRQAQAALECARAGEIVRFHAPGSTVKGKLKWWEVTVSPILDAEGRPERLLVIARDITERKQAEEHVGRFRIALDSAADNIFLIDPETMRYLDVSQSACRDLGYSREELLQLGPPQIMPQLSDEELQRRFEEVRANPAGSGAIETVHFRKDGTGFEVEVVLRPVEIQGRQLLVAVARDITERKRAEAALRQSEERLKLAQQAGHVGVFDWEIQTDSAIIGGELEHIFGAPPGVEAITYQNWLKYVEPEDLPRIAQEFEECIRVRGHQLEHQYRIRRPDGQMRWLEVKGRISYLDDGRPERMIGTIVDITGRKLAEDALRESEGKFRALAENARACFGIVQGQRFVYANPYFAQMSGYTEEELLQADFPQLVHPDFRAPMVEWARRRQVGEPAPNFYEFAMLTKAGEKRWIEFSVGTTMYRGHPAIIGTGFDITERKRAEDALRLRNERLALLSAAAAHLLKAENPDTMILELFEKVSRHLDLQGYMNFMVNEAGDALRLDSYAGVPEEAARIVSRLEFGQGVCGTVAQRCQPIYAVHIQQSQAEMVLLLKSLGIRAYACNPLIAQGRLLGTLAFATNTRDEFSEDDLEFMRAISQYAAMAKERLRLEGELRRHIDQLAAANAQLAEADRRKNEFLAMLAHELRNPLAPIRNAMQVLRMVDLQGPVQQRQGDIIDRQITHMARLLNDLLDVSRITRGKIELSRQPLSLVDVLTHAVETARPLIDQRHHTLTIAPPPPALRVLGDLDRLAQVVGNLLTNAAKYTEEGGQIWLEAAREGSEAVIRVRDTGVGIAPDLLPQIFELFTQADHSLARSQGGLGIGLTMVRSLVEMHGGSVEAHSAGVNQGSEFTIRLPALDDAGGAGETLQTEPRFGVMTGKNQPRRVLVVDDIIDTVQSLSELLRLWGHHVHVAYNGSGALAAARVFKPEVVLLDIGLPDLDGFEVARRLRHEPGGDLLIIVALTGYGQKSDQQLSSAAGFNHHLVKPVDLHLLARLL